LFKIVAILFIVCYPLFVFYTREPDFQDSDYTKGIIHFIQDSQSQHKEPVAFFTFLHQQYKVKAGYLFKNYQEGQKVDIIYDTGDPSDASVYSPWGYWIRWKELLVIIAIFAGLYQVAAALTSNPTPEALIEELEAREKKPRRKKYDD
jgi:hypothetical protein